MKENLKVNILWLLLLLAGYGLISVLVSVGVLNLFYVQIFTTNLELILFWLLVST